MESIVLDCASPAVSAMDRKSPRIVSSAVADGYLKDTLSTQTSTASDYVFERSQELDEFETTEDTSTTLAFGDSMESIVLDCASPAVSSMDKKLPRIVSSAVADGYVKDTLSTQKSTASDYVFASQKAEFVTTEDTSTTLTFGDSMEFIVLDCASPAVSSMDRKLPRIVSSAVADGYLKDTLSKTQKSTASDYVFASQKLDLETTEDTSTT